MTYQLPRKLTSFCQPTVFERFMQSLFKMTKYYSIEIYRSNSQNIRKTQRKHKKARNCTRKSILSGLFLEHKIGVDIEEIKSNMKEIRTKLF